MIPWSLVHIPKTAGASINAACGTGFTDHMPASRCSGFLATFVRNPFARFHSAFEFLRDPRWNQRVIPEATTFREFVTGRHFETADTLYFKPMAWWLDAPVGFVGRFESLTEDFKRLCGLLGFVQPVTLPRIHVRSGPPWESAYDADTRSIVRAAYRDDLVRFGYGT